MGVESKGNYLMPFDVRLPGSFVLCFYHTQPLGLLSTILPLPDDQMRESLPNTSVEDGSA